MHIEFEFSHRIVATRETDWMATHGILQAKQHFCNTLSCYSMPEKQWCQVGEKGLAPDYFQQPLSSDNQKVFHTISLYGVRPYETVDHLSWAKAQMGRKAQDRRLRAAIQDQTFGNGCLHQRQNKQVSQTHSLSGERVLGRHIIRLLNVFSEAPKKRQHKTEAESYRDNGIGFENICFSKQQGELQHRIALLAFSYKKTAVVRELCLFRQI